MPKTLEVVCKSPDCGLDMFELHYTYGVGDFTCPYCGSSDGIEEIQV
jgi:predicted RNA-binding Zn-ribbon protein involved in translation (DUF1610 family)